MAESGGVVKLLELEATVLGSKGLKGKDCGAAVSSAENLGKQQTDFLSICTYVEKPQRFSWNTVINDRSKIMIYLSFRLSFTVG